MRLIFLSTLLLLFAGCQRKPFFEGEINYDLSFSPENAMIDSVLLKDYYGDRCTLQCKNGNLLWRTSNGIFMSYLYVNRDNKFYYQSKNSNTVAWKLGTKPTDSLISIIDSDPREMILNHPCRMIQIKSKLLQNNVFRTRSYYYSPEVKISPDWFSKTINSNFNLIFAKTGALPLRIVDNFGTFTIAYEATSVIKKDLDDALFLPPSTNLIEIE